MNETILIIEDDTDINNMLAKLLSKSGYKTLSAFSGTEGVLVFDNNVQLVLLDLMLPGRNGEDIIHELKAKNNVPIIVMSAISNVEKKVDLFSLGADDYVTKPFDNAELLARIGARLRGTSEKVSDNIITVGKITADKSTYTVTICQKTADFSRTEFDLLYMLMKNAGKVCTKSVIYDKVWNYEDSADDNTLNVHISHIRNKLKEYGADSGCIETVWGIGYRMRK